MVTVNDEIKELSDWDKARKTAKWSEIMTKVAIAKINKRWRPISFRGPNDGESRGIIDMIVIRKNQTLKDPKYSDKTMKPGDLFDIILIQIKGGAAPDPTVKDKKRMLEVGKYYHAKCCILSQWQKGEMPSFYRLDGFSLKWNDIESKEIFK